MMLVLRRKWDFEGHHNFSSWSAKWIENDISSMHFDCRNENNWKYFIIHLILSQKCTRRWGFPSHYLFVGENITKYQIERIQIYTDCKISVSLFGSSEMLLSHGKTSFCGGADEFFEYIFPASRCYGGAHLDSGHRPPWFCLKIFRKTIFLQGHQHHKNNNPTKYIIKL